jgi:hypothetical protein
VVQRSSKALAGQQLGRYTSLVYIRALTLLQRSNYDVWLNQIVAEYQLRLDRKDRMFARFLLDLPSVPSDVFTLLRDLCAEPDRCVPLSLLNIHLLIDK